MGMTYEGFLDSITQWGALNTWLIEEVEWSTRYCNDLDRLVPCAAAPGGINRENNMVDPERWENWLILLDFVKGNGEVMTMGDWALAVTTDNCPGLVNPTQSDVDADGRGDPCDVERIAILGDGPGSLVSVAVLGTDLMDVRDIDPETLEFGPDGARPARPIRYEDVDGDDRVDLVAQFRARDTGITADDTEACLSGIIGSSPFTACASLQGVPIVRR